jgi:hypothetical protein
MRLGKVFLDIETIVDLDNPEMVERAKNILYEDIMYAGKFDEIFDCIKTAEAPDATEGDIPDFLLENEEDF